MDYEFIEAERALKAIQYGERVDQSRTSSSADAGMVNQVKNTQRVLMYRITLTCPLFRDLLDKIVVRNMSISDIYRHDHPGDDTPPKPELIRLRTMIKAALENFHHVCKARKVPQTA